MHRPDQQARPGRVSTVAGEPGKAQAQPGGRVRNGKAVRKVLRATAPDGRLVRVVLYEDGTQEQVVQ